MLHILGWQISAYDVAVVLLILGGLAQGHRDGLARGLLSLLLTLLAFTGAWYVVSLADGGAPWRVARGLTERVVGSTSSVDSAWPETALRALTETSTAMTNRDAPGTHGQQAATPNYTPTTGPVTATEVVAELILRGLLLLILFAVIGWLARRITALLPIGWLDGGPVGSLLGGLCSGAAALVTVTALTSLVLPLALLQALPHLGQALGGSQLLPWVWRLYEWLPALLAR